MAVSILVLTQTLVQPMKSRSCWTVFSPLRNVKILLTRSVSITILANVMPTPSVTPLRTIGKVWLRMSRIFLNGHDDKIVNQLKAKMKDMSDQMAFERAAEYRDLIEAVSTLRTKQRVIRQDMQDRDIFGYYVDKGWMCSGFLCSPRKTHPA